MDGAKESVGGAARAPGITVAGLLSPEPWKTRYLFSIGARSWLIHVFVVLLAFVAQQNLSLAAQAWLTGMIALSLVLAGLCQYGQRLPDVPPRALAIAAWFHSALTATVGLLWAWGAFVAAEAGFDNLLLYTLALGGTALGAVSSQHAVMRSCLLSIWTSVPGLAAAHLALDATRLGQANAAMIVLYGAVLTILATRMHRFVASNHALVERLDRQVHQLRYEKKRADMAQEARTRFLAHASHDLRQPVHTMNLLISLLRENELDRDARDIVGKIDLSLTSLSELFQSLLDFSILDLGRMRVSTEAVDLNAVLNRLAKQNMPLVERMGGAIVVSPTSVWVETDPRLLTTMLQNLISNAAKYAPGSTVLMGVRHRKNGIAVVVADQGPGIGEADRPRIFDEFYRSDDDAERVQGLGLGLPLVVRFAELLGHDCRLETRPGHGTLVEIGAMKRVAACREAVKGRWTAAHLLSGLEVYLVDRDGDTRKATEVLLENWGCVVAPEGSAARLGRSKPGLILLNHGMNGNENAAQAITAIREQAGKTVPAIVVSGTLDHEALGIAGLDDVQLLAKPAPPAQLRASLVSLALSTRD